MTADLRWAREDEVPALEDLMREASLIWPDHRDDLLAPPDAIEVPVDGVRGRRVRVDEQDGEVTGFAIGGGAPPGPPRGGPPAGRPGRARGASRSR